MPRAKGRPPWYTERLDEKLSPFGGVRAVVLRLDEERKTNGQIADWLYEQTGIRVSTAWVSWMVNRWLAEAVAEKEEVVA